MTLIKKYFPQISDSQIMKLSTFEKLIKEWNKKINLISRKDVENFQINHLIHSLSISKLILFEPKTKVLDIGTGGGLPGIPLAIFFPKTMFHLVDRKQKKIDVLVTAPIHKKAIQSKEFNFKGHTDYLNSKFKGSSLMFMITNELKVGLLTEHVPLSSVKELITEELITNKVEGIHRSLLNDFSITKPRIAVLGINPHSGDNGVIGNEDDQLLKPILKKISSTGKLVYGPYPADSFFGSDNYKNFDAIIAAYHDQGLIPFKTLSFGYGVNYTSGLEIIRTSPDHGTAFEIAGKGIADETSFKEAMFAAIDIYNTRNQEYELSKNALTVFRLPKNKKSSKPKR